MPVPPPHARTRPPDHLLPDRIGASPAPVRAHVPRLRPPAPPQQTQDARSRKGAVSTFLKGTGRQRESLLGAQEELSLLFKQVVDDVERNNGTQVRGPRWGSLWPGVGRRVCSAA